MILLRPDQQDYLGTAVTVDLARRLGVPSMMLVVNKALPSIDAATVRRQMEQTYGAPVAALLPLCEEMMRLGSGDLFAGAIPTTRLRWKYALWPDGWRDEIWQTSATIPSWTSWSAP